MKFLLIVSSAAILSLFLNCNKKQPNPEFPLSLKLRILNNQGQEVTNIQQGQNFTLSFILVNNTSILYFLKSMDATNLFSVYATDNGKTLVGKPWKTIFCQYTNGYPIPAHDTTKFEIPWQPDTTKSYLPFCLLSKTMPLAAGDYQTGFSSNFILINGNQTIQSESQTFNINFEIK